MKQKEGKMKFVVHTQTLENYGAHSESGKYADGQAYWKFKSGETYVVEGLERMQDAVAFVAAISLDNGIGFKEFPCHYTTYDEWMAELADDSEDYREYQIGRAITVNPETYSRLRKAA
jgi:hypothetical protein